MSPPRIDYTTHLCRRCGACEWKEGAHGTHYCLPCRRTQARTWRAAKAATDPAWVVRERATRARYFESLKDDPGFKADTAARGRALRARRRASRKEAAE